MSNYNSGENYSSAAISGLIIVLLGSALLLSISGIVATPLRPLIENPTAIHSLLLSFEANNPIWASLLAAATIAIGAIITMRITISENLYSKPSHLPAIIYIALCVAFSQPNDIYTPTLAALLMSMGLKSLLRAYTIFEAADWVFVGCFWLGAVALLYPSTIILALLIPAIMVILDRSLREIFVIVAGMVTPALTLLYVRWFVEGATIEDQWCEGLDRLGTNAFQFGDSWSWIGVYLLVVVLAIYAIANIDSVSIKLTSRTRTLFVVVTLLATTIAIALPIFNPAQLVAIAAPAAITTTAALYELPSRWSTIFYLMTILATLLAPFLP